MKTLFLLLPPAPVTMHSAWAFLESPDGRHAGRFASATTALLPRPGRGAGQVILVIPAQAVSWHRVQWPRTLAAGSGRLRAALDGMLEDHLLDDPASLHMAMEPGVQGGARAWVATLDRAWLVSALELLERQGLQVTRILPELTPATGPHPTLQVTATDGVEWRVDLGNPNQTARSGFVEGSAKTGDAIVVLGNKALDKSKWMKAVRITVAGKQFDMYPERIRSN